MDLIGNHLFSNPLFPEFTLFSGLEKKEFRNQVADAGCFFPGNAA